MKDMSTPPASRRLLWHASSATMAGPTVAGRTPGEGHANSGLGLFCATAPNDYLTGFGDRVYELTVECDPSRVMQMTVQELMKMSMAGYVSRQQFESQGRSLARIFDIVDLVECDGSIAQSIVLNDAAIVSSRSLTREQFASMATARRPGRPGPG